MQRFNKARKVKSKYQAMDTQIFHKFRELIHSESGISLSPEKEPLLSSRIAKRLRVLHLTEAEIFAGP